MTTKNIPISQIYNNTGQVEGLPGNPRITNPVKLDKLVESIKQDPEMLQLRGCWFIPLRMVNMSPLAETCACKP
jgi:hypothetical protein